jgi:hypothetical protein
MRDMPMPIRTVALTLRIHVIGSQILQPLENRMFGSHVSLLQTAPVPCVCKSVGFV